MDQDALGWSPAVLWYENDTAVHSVTGKDRTGQDNKLRNVCLSGSPLLPLLSSPIVSCLGKTFAIHIQKVYQSI